MTFLLLLVLVYSCCAVRDWPAASYSPRRGRRRRSPSSARRNPRFRGNAALRGRRLIEPIIVTPCLTRIERMSALRLEDFVPPTDLFVARDDYAQVAQRL